MAVISEGATTWISPLSRRAAPTPPAAVEIDDEDRSAEARGLAQDAQAGLRAEILGDQGAQALIVGQRRHQAAFFCGDGAGGVSAVSASANCPSAVWPASVNT